MPKGRIQLRLSQTALDNLEQQAQAAGLTRQDYVEEWLAPASLGVPEAIQIPDRGTSQRPSAFAVRAKKVGSRKPERLDDIDHMRHTPGDPEKEEAMKAARTKKWSCCGRPESEHKGSPATTCPTEADIKEARAQRKLDRATRKSKTQSTIKDALPSRKPLSLIGDSVERQKRLSEAAVEALTGRPIKDRGSSSKATVETFTRPLAPIAPGPMDVSRAANPVGLAALQAKCFHPAASRTSGKNWRCRECGYVNEG